MRPRMREKETTERMGLVNDFSKGNGGSANDRPDQTDQNDREESSQSNQRKEEAYA